MAIDEKKLVIVSPRQQRALIALSQGNVSSLELRKIAGVLNAPQLISDLRKLGWKIWCRRVKKNDQDGKLCSPGIKMKRLALIAVSEGTAETAPTDSTEITSKIYNRRIAGGRDYD